jgi:CheY-like chemotaxis protein
MSESGRILLVGDAQGLHAIFAAGMQAGDIVAVPDVTSGLEHVRRSRTAPPRLIVLEADGMAIADAVGTFKGDAQAQAVPILVLCKSADAALFAACYRAGANACAIRPAAAADLHALVATVTAYWLQVNEVPPPA